MATKKAASKKSAPKKAATTKAAAKKAAKPTTPRTRKTKAVEPENEAVPRIEIPVPAAEILDPIGDTTDGEARTLLSSDSPAESIAPGIAPIETAGDGSLETEAPEAEDDADSYDDEDDDEDADSEDDADSEEDEDSDENANSDDTEPGFTRAPRPPAKLERLQKILSQAGVASRRKAEEMIEEGRVQVNGTVVTELGTKADAGRDHIRVDGKLLHGAERLRYFVLNKPKGFVTTVKDPEGRPTVMQFFEKMRERLYPVGRLDYMSEGLLLVTNDGDLANKLTKAGSGVEKVYLVKVAGQPSEDELDLLRGGVAIERGKPGSPKVRTSPARIRQVRQGDNPWYEVVLIEGRNRELRKMFSAVGHFVEKIRRVGYGPLVLDLEPGNMRELQAEELASLRLAAEGKLRTPKSKDIRRRNLADSGLPTVRPKASPLRPARPSESRGPARPFESSRPAKPFGTRTSSDSPGFDKRPAAPSRPGEFRARPAFGKDRPAGAGFRPASGRPGAEAGKFGPGSRGPARFGADRPAWKKPDSTKPAWKKDDRAARPPARFTPSEGGEARPPAAKPYAAKPYGDRPATGRTFGAKPAGRPFTARPAVGRPAPDRRDSGKPAWQKPGKSDRPPFKRPAAPRREEHDDEEFPVIRPGGLRIDPIESNHTSTRPDNRPSRPPRPGGASARPAFNRPKPDRPNFDRARSDRPNFDRSGTGKPSFDRPRSEYPRPARPGSDRPSFAKPRFDKPRFDRSSGGSGAASGAPRPPRGESGLGRPFTTSSGKPRAGGARPSSKPFKPGGFSKPRPGGFSKSGPKAGGFKGKPGGPKRSGPGKHR